MRNKLTTSIYKTLCYSEVFSYPLTSFEIWQFVMHHKKVSHRKIQSVLSQSLVIEEKDGYYTLLGRTSLVQTRQERLMESKKKIVKALSLSAILMYIPTIELIGVSGSLSMHNARKEDDIDLFFITKRHTLWLTRFIVNVFLLILSEKRSKKSRFAIDKICPNMFMSENALTLSVKNRNIYTAHEVAQLKVLYSKNDTHHKFLAANKWVLRYLPNSFEIKKTPKKSKPSLLSLVLLPVNAVFFVSQYIYMMRSITHENVSYSTAMFHPVKTDNIVTSLFKLKLKHIGKQVKKTHKKRLKDTILAVN